MIHWKLAPPAVARMAGQGVVTDSTREHGESPSPLPRGLGAAHGFVGLTRSCVAGWVARVGSGLFLCAQILMLLDFVVAWNDSWVDKEDER